MANCKFWPPFYEKEVKDEKGQSYCVKTPPQTGPRNVVAETIGVALVFGALFGIVGYAVYSASKNV